MSVDTLLVMAQRSSEDSQDLDGRQEPRLLQAIEMIAPGTDLREGVDAILSAGTGGLLVLGEPEEINHLCSGGIKLDVEYTPTMLYQLAKMDGALILDSGCTKIAAANVQLIPDPTISTQETGTRHRTAERVSRQMNVMVVAISQRRETVSLYVDGQLHQLDQIPVVLAKANQALATLDKYRRRLDQLTTRLTALEFEGGASLHDVLTVLQRAELVSRMAAEIERYIFELGREGRLIEMQLEESMVGTASDKQALIQDYIVSYNDELVNEAQRRLDNAGHAELLDFGQLAEILGYDRKLNTLDHLVVPRGFRVLGRIPRLPKMVIGEVVAAFDGLDDLLDGVETRLDEVQGVGDIRAKDIREGLRRLQEVNLVDRVLQ